MPRGVKKEQPEVVRWLVQTRWSQVKWVNWLLTEDTVLAYGWSDGSMTWQA